MAEDHDSAFMAVQPAGLEQSEKIAIHVGRRLPPRWAAPGQTKTMA
jgi:hypothetical protein